MAARPWCEVGSDRHAGGFSQRVSAPARAADFSSSLVPCWLFTFYTNELWGDKFNSQLCQTCIFFPDLLSPLCSVGTMPCSVPCLDPSFACAGAEAQAFARLFALNPWQVLMGKEKKRRGKKNPCYKTVQLSHRCPASGGSESISAARKEIKRLCFSSHHLYPLPSPPGTVRRNWGNAKNTPTSWASKKLLLHFPVLTVAPPRPLSSKLSKHSPRVSCPLKGTGLGLHKGSCETSTHYGSGSTKGFLMLWPQTSSRG